MNPIPETRPSLLLRLRDAGNNEAWEAFVQVYTPLIYGYCLRRDLQDADAADVAQDVMATVVSAIRTFEYDPARGSFRGWLLTVTRSRMLNHLARRGRNPAASVHRPGAGADPTAELEGQPTADESERWELGYRRRLFDWASDKVRQEVEPRTWRAFWLTAIEQQDGERTAAETGLSVGAVYVARSRVTARLRDLIASVANDPPDVAPYLRP
jgi:RNA polymerase sigma-70 factor (ECF subfamily)